MFRKMLLFKYLGFLNFVCWLFFVFCFFLIACLFFKTNEPGQQDQAMLHRAKLALLVPQPLQSLLFPWKSMLLAGAM